MGQVFAGNEIHREVMLAVALPDFVNADDVRMPQAAGRFRLALKSPHVMGRSQPAGQNHLHRHQPAQVGLSGFVHHAHPAPAGLGEQFVFAELARNPQ